MADHNEDSGIKPIRRYGKGDQVHVTAQRIWMILVALAKARTLPDVTIRPPSRTVPTITYGELCEMVERSYKAGRTLGRELMTVGAYCKLNGLPCLNALVVNLGGDCGHGVVLTDGNDPAMERRAISKVDWFKFGVPTTGTLRKVYSAESKAH